MWRERRTGLMPRHRSELERALFALLACCENPNWDDEPSARCAVAQRILELTSILDQLVELTPMAVVDHVVAHFRREHLSVPETSSSLSTSCSNTWRHVSPRADASRSTASAASRCVTDPRGRRATRGPERRYRCPSGTPLTSSPARLSASESIGRFPTHTEIPATGSGSAGGAGSLSELRRGHESPATATQHASLPSRSR